MNGHRNERKALADGVGNRAKKRGKQSGERGDENGSLIQNSEDRQGSRD